MLNTRLILEYVKLLGMTVVYTAGEWICFWVLLPVLADAFGAIDFQDGGDG